jgi:hypothetical protein
VKKVLSLFFVLISATVFAQVERGKYLAGGSADISVSYTGKNSTFNMSLTPQFGVFVVRGFAIGGRYAFGISSTRNFDNNKKEYVSTSTFTSGIGPILRYYIGKKQLKGIISASANYLTSTTLRKNSVSGTTGFSTMGLAGIAYFLNPHLSLETGLYAATTSFAKQLTTLRVGLSVGFFVFLDNKKKEKPLMNESQEFKKQE